MQVNVQRQCTGDLLRGEVKADALEHQGPMMLVDLPNRARRQSHTSQSPVNAQFSDKVLLVQELANIPSRELGHQFVE